MRFERHRRTILSLPAVVVVMAGCALTADNPEAAPVVTPPTSLGDNWWEKNKHRREFVPGRGYVVAGVPGYFDENGLPVTSGVRAASFDESVEVPTESNAAPAAVAAARSQKKASFLDRMAAAVGRGPDEAEARELYTEGDAYFRQQKYADAARRFAKSAKRLPDSPLEEDAMFMRAESYFFSDNYPKANDAYEALLKKYPNTRRLDDVVKRQFAIAHYWDQYHQNDPQWPVTPNLLDKTRHRFDTVGHALRVYESIRLNDPTGPLADDALMATAGAYFTQGRYADADYHYGLLRREYPKSEHQFNAHLLGLQSKLRMYQGPAYDGTVLEEAEKLVSQLLTQFPDQVHRERERIVKMRAEIAAQQALRSWSRAEYYARGRHFGAARHYYEKVVRDYPQTKLAQEARTQLVSLEGRPDQPPQRLAWLVNLFEEQRRPQASDAPETDGSTMLR